MVPSVAITPILPFLVAFVAVTAPGFTTPIMGISNDSSMTVSPIFWAIAGLGVYLNSQSAKLRKERKSATE